MDDLQRLIEISEAADLDTLRTRLVNLAGEMDFDYVTCTMAFAGSGAHADIATVHNVPAAFTESYLSLDAADRDPVVKRLRSLVVPFVYDQALYVREGAADLWEEQASFGFKTGVAVSIRLPHGRQFLLGVDRSKALPRSVQKLARLMGDLQLMAVYAQSAAERLLVQDLSSRSAVRLTARELEILEWVWKGKSKSVIGDILNLSRHTVDFHLRAVMAKFGVASMHVAANKARELGLI